LDAHSPIHLAFRPSKVIQQGAAVQLVICGLNLLFLVDNEDGNAPNGQWSRVELVSPSDLLAGVIDVERCHTWKRCF
jgi:hypothetical protein